MSEDDLQNIRTLLGQYVAQRLTGLADQAWEQQDWTAQTCTAGWTRKTVMRVIFDTNVLLIALPSHSPFHVFYQAVVAERLTLYVTTKTVKLEQ